MIDFKKRDNYVKEQYKLFEEKRKIDQAKLQAERDSFDTSAGILKYVSLIEDYFNDDLNIGSHKYKLSEGYIKYHEAENISDSLNRVLDKKYNGRIIVSVECADIPQNNDDDDDDDDTIRGYCIKVSAY
jgi:hypothetical protein